MVGLELGLGEEVEEGVTVMLGVIDTVIDGVGLPLGADEVDGETVIDGVLDSDAVGLTD